MLRIGSLCSGAGGLDLAVEAVFAAKTVWQSEIDSAAAKVLAARWPNVPNLGDITAIDWTAVEPVDILIGGYPCQPFSQAGQRKGADDERHLWPHVREAIRGVRPRITFLENVSGHRSLGFDRVLGDLAEDGMYVWWTSIRASDIGAPHGRERLFFVVTPDASGYRRQERAQPDRGPQRSELPSSHRDNSDGCHYNAVGGLLGTPTARDGKGSPSLGFNRGSLPDLIASGLLPTPQARDHTGGKPDVAAMKRISSNGRPFYPNLNDLASAELLARPQARVESGSRWGRFEAAIRRWEQITGRPAPEPTEPSTQGKRRPRVRCEFSEWLMGWPRGWVTDLPLSRAQMLVAIGNGVVPQQAAAALKQLLEMTALETEF